MEGIAKGTSFKNTERHFKKQGGAPNVEPVYPKDKYKHGTALDRYRDHRAWQFINPDKDEAQLKRRYDRLVQRHGWETASKIQL